MNELQKIKEDVENAVSDYSSSFGVEVYQEDEGCHAEVTLRYQFSEDESVHEYCFDARVVDGKTEFCRYEDVFEALTTEELFIWLFFKNIEYLERT